MDASLRSRIAPTDLLAFGDGGRHRQHRAPHNRHAAAALHKLRPTQPSLCGANYMRHTPPSVLCAAATGLSTAMRSGIHAHNLAGRATTAPRRLATLHRRGTLGVDRTQPFTASAVDPRVATSGPSSSSGTTKTSFNLNTNNSTGVDAVSTSDDSVSAPGVMDNSSVMSMTMDWDDWISSSASDSGECVLLPGGTHTGNGDGSSRSGSSNGSSGSSSSSNGAAAGRGPAAGSAATVPGFAATIRIAFYAIASSFDLRQLETMLKTAYGKQCVRKYPDVIHCQLSRARDGQPGADVFFFNYGVVACWGLTQELERELVQNLAAQCAVQLLPPRDHEQDVFRCTFTTNPISTLESAAAAPAAPEAPAKTSLATLDAMGSLLDVEGPSSSTGGTTSSRRFTRRAERSGGAAAVVAAVASSSIAQPPTAAAAAPQEEEEVKGLPPPAGPFSVLSFPPQITDDTVLLHVRHCGDTATLLAVSYALAQSTKLSAFEKAVAAIVEETQALPEALAEHGRVQLSGTEIGRLIGKVFVLKRSVNLLGSVAGTPEFFWYAPDQLQSLYTRITGYVELSERVEQLNGRFAVLQEMLELLRAQEENRHGNRLELVVIWLIVVEVVLGFFELLELFGVVGPQHGL